MTEINSVEDARALVARWKSEPPPSQPTPPPAPKPGPDPDTEEAWAAMAAAKAECNSATAPREQLQPGPSEMGLSASATRVQLTPKAATVATELQLSCTPEYYDVAAMLDGTMPTPPIPSIGKRDDGLGLFYPRQYNVIFGDPESGKTLLADYTTVEVLKDGGKVLRLDIDHNGPESSISRLIAFGAPLDALRDPERFLYVEPEDRRHVGNIVDHMKVWEPTLVVIDSIGELLPMFGAKSNDADEFTKCHTEVIKPLMRTGAAVVGIDHLSKGTDSRAYGQTGSAAKKRAIGGTSLRVNIDVAFTPGKGGSAYITVNKDRHGGLRANCPVGDREPLAGKFVLEPQPDGEKLRGRIRAPMPNESSPDEKASTEDIAAVAALVPPPASARDARVRLGWSDKRTRDAFKSWKSQPEPENNQQEIS